MTALGYLGSSTVTIAAVVLASVCACIAWRTVRAARRQSEQRVAALAAAIQATATEGWLAGWPGENLTTFSAYEAEPAATTEDMATIAHPPCLPARQGRPLAPVVVSLAAGVALTALAGVALWGAVRPVARAALDRGPLELATLQHGVSASAFTVSGEVAVPAGRPVRDLAVELVTLDREGHTLASSGAPVDLSTGTPRAHVPFSVSVPYSGSVDHYTIRFRDAFGLRPHLDRRRGQTVP